MKPALQGLILLSAVAAWPATIGLQASQTPSSEAPKFDVEVDLVGLVGLVPDGNGVQEGTPMGDGSAERIFALFPRAGSEEDLAELPVPDELEWLVRKGRKQPAHYLFFRIPAKSVGAEGDGCVYVPLPPPGEDDHYTVEFDGVSPAGEAASYKDFGNVQPVVGGTGAQYAVLDPDTLDKRNRVTGRLAFGAGWVLKAQSMERGPMVRMSCWDAFLFSYCSDPRPVEGSKPQRAQRVRAAIKDQTGPITLLVRNAKKQTILALDLKQPAANQPLWLLIGHAQLSELFGGHDTGPEHHHFNLYHLLTKAIAHPYYYPHRGAIGSPARSAHHAVPCSKSEIESRTDPFCTPLAQLVRKK